MNLHAELALQKLDPATQKWLNVMLEQAKNSVQEITQKNAELVAQHYATIVTKDAKIQTLSYELAYYKRLRYGRSHEALSISQLDLFNETIASDIAAVEAEVVQACHSPRAPRKNAGRAALPADLPRIEIRHEPESCDCAACGRALVSIGEDISEQLDVEPAKFTVIRHIRPQYACRACETVTAAPITPAVIDGGVATPALLAWVMVQKYLDHLPLYRIEQIASRHGAPLARSTLAEWVGKVGVALQPLADRLTERLKARHVLHADETPVQQLDPGAGKTKRAYLWVYRSNDLEPDPPIVVFDYQISRAGKHAIAFLNDWQGHLMVDDYAGYKALFRAGIIELACLAHVRRKFFDLHAANANPHAQAALARIARLYAIEQQGKTMTTSERKQLRYEQAIPECAALHTWLIEMRLKAAPNGALARALDYAIKRWPAVTRYAHSGNLPIDNNPVENSIRPIAIGKKNWLFTGSERAGIRACAIQTLLGTAKLNGIEPLAWLTETLEKLPLWPNSRIDELLPLRAAPSIVG